MAMSPLTLAMLGGSQQMQDPAYMPAMRKLGLAQQFMAQGTDASPTVPLGALARVLQSALGGYLMTSGDREFQDITGQRQKQAADAISMMNGPDAGAAAGAAAAPAAMAPAAAPAAPVAPVASAPLAAAAHQLESGGSMAPGIVGDGGAGAGPMQVHQAALTDVNRAQGTNYTLDQLKTDPGLGKKVGDAYLALQQERFPGRPDLALAAYNAGPTATAQAVQNGTGVAGLPPSTQAYVAKGLALAGQPGGDAAPGVGAAPPGGAASPATGVNAPMVKAALSEFQRAQQALSGLDPRNPNYAHVAQLAQMHIQHAQMLMGLDQYVTRPDGTQLNTRTNQASNAPAPLAHYVPTDTGSVDTTGTHPPTFMPSPRIAQTPAGAVVAVGPGGQQTTVAPVDTAGIAGRKQAEAQGTQTGERTAATSDRMFDIGRESDQALGNIDYGLNQLHQAAAGGINSGYFAPWLATAAAAGKSLGVNLQGLGINPEAVGNAQSAQKTLGVVAGTILQNTIGKDSQITDAKIEHFIHTQPGIETDPQALDRIMSWARSQFVYNRDMALDAMQHTDNTGMLPPGWRADFVKRKGAFAPIYDPLSGEMKQPNGQGPAAEPPGGPAPSAPAQPAPPAQPAVTEGRTATGPGGKKIIFRGGQWVPM